MEEITDDAFRQLLSFFSDWYDQRGWISMLKVLYRDLFENKFELNKAAKVIDMIDSLIDIGVLHLKDLSLLYDTINISKQYGLERKIKDNLLPSFPNVKDMIISKFTPHRQKVMKLGMVLIDEDIKKISGLYNKPVKEYADTWSLILDLEHNRIICEGNMDAFIEKLNTLKLQQAVEVFKEDIQTPKPSLNPGQASVSQVASSHAGKKRRKGVKCTLKRKKKDYRSHPEYVLNLLEELDKQKGFLTLIHKPKGFAILKRVVMYYEHHGLKLDKVEVGCIVFHLSTHDPNALLNLWEIHSSGKLIKDLTGVLVPEKHQQEFLDEWMTYIDENEYKAALRILKGNASEGILEHSGDSDKEHDSQLVKPKMVQYGSCIISDDMEWESQLVVDLTQRRPELRFAILRHWKLSKPETINDLIARSRKVIIAFSPKPLTEYSKYAAHSVVKMLEENILDDAQIIPIKISEDSVVPPEFASFTVINTSEENFVDKILQGLNESGKYCSPAICCYYHHFFVDYAK
ncbi:uncharacterized protein LOC117110337 isoform X2 [Anneissia japonica]|uniref:uncharacterized protein LOC117110337 isoform X2 n=1 Tax=Anneissia japonica TaxID=1529436 RepID=UPI001425A03F|nr:uncharacterized protein LOC117110337 isoform X2 [Anneissia japonica]